MNRQSIQNSAAFHEDGGAATGHGGGKAGAVPPYAKDLEACI
jgi:hypothetical protein